MDPWEFTVVSSWNCSGLVMWVLTDGARLCDEDGLCESFDLL